MRYELRPDFPTRIIVLYASESEFSCGNFNKSGNIVKTTGKF